MRVHHLYNLPPADFRLRPMPLNSGIFRDMDDLGSVAIVRSGLSSTDNRENFPLLQAIFRAIVKSGQSPMDTREDFPSI